MSQFTPQSLPKAIRTLFELNHYSVTEHVNVHGAEVDLITEPLAPFGSRIFIEATVEFVNNDKYGKDVGKFALIRQKEPDAKLLIVSAVGFSAPVKERATESGFDTLKYDELFRKFETFEPYISEHIDGTEKALELQRLSEVYEEPRFQDAHGEDVATEYLSNWISSDGSKGRWLLVSGEYGTGKTALTRVLQYRLLKRYRVDPSIALPVRIELRNFTKQFDELGLLHHFLDNNRLGHVPAEFLLSLIAQGRILLILDGYDEMAQYLHSRERRSCLETFAKLSRGGAMGILTSRPNYFTEAEELQVFESLYRSLEHGKYFLGAEARKLLDQERQTDELLASFLERYERILKDLSPQQTEALIQRVLADDPEGAAVVNGMLRRIFRSISTQDETALSGKPVIVSYLLEVVEGLKQLSTSTGSQSLTEWQVYKLIVDQLMLRDFQRVSETSPTKRRAFLHRLAIFLSSREHASISEDEFRELIAKDFKQDWSKYPAESQAARIEQLFSDFRSSTTLTRGGSGSSEGWRFSHNSLREYLVAEALVRSLKDNIPLKSTGTISDVMKLFSASIEAQEIEVLAELLALRWKQGSIYHSRGQILDLLLDGFARQYADDNDPVGTSIKSIAGDPPNLSDCHFSRTNFQNLNSCAQLQNADFSGCVMSEAKFRRANLEEANLGGCLLDGVDFAEANLKGASFARTILMGVNFCNTMVTGADFSLVNPEDITFIACTGRQQTLRALEGFSALGYLRTKGALTKEVDVIFELEHHETFPVFDKIVENLSKQSLHQARGLSQRGAAHQDVDTARALLDHLKTTKLLVVPKNRKDLVEVTAAGRAVFSAYMESRAVSSELLGFFGR